MLNRRILRIKAFKVLYSYAENPSMTISEAEALLEESCEATRSLYLFMLDIIPYLTAEARTRIENARNKFNPSEEERNPNMKFVRNAVSPLLEQDPDFRKIVSRRKLSWEPYDALIRNVYDSICSKEYFKEYMSVPESSLEEDVRLFVRIFEEEFVDNEELDRILEDQSILWCDDLAYSLTVCCDTLKSLARGTGGPCRRSTAARCSATRMSRATRPSSTSLSAPPTPASGSILIWSRKAHPNGRRTGCSRPTWSLS